MIQKLRSVRIALLVAPVLLGACASTSMNEKHRYVELIGRITATTELERTSGTSAFHRGGMLGIAGALGGIIGGAAAAAATGNGTFKYAMYDISSESMPQRLVRVGFPLGLDISQCVQVLVESPSPEKQVFLLGEASLRKTDGCRE